MPPKTKEPSRISLFDIFIGSGRTIRGNKGSPGFPFLRIDGEKALPNKTAPKAEQATAKKDTKPEKPAETKTEDKKAQQTDLPKPSEDSDKTAVDPDAFTAEEDEKLRKLKAENKSWKEIATETGKPQWQLKKRFRELNAQGKDDSKPDEPDKKMDERKTPSKKAESVKEKKEDKPVASKKDKKSKESGKKEDKPTNGSPKAASKTSSRTAVKLTPEEYVKLLEDDDFSPTELAEIAKIVTADMDKRWLRVASRFFDKTGRAIPEDQLRQKFKSLDGDA